MTLSLQLSMPHRKVKVSMKKLCGIIQDVNAKYLKSKDPANFKQIQHITFTEQYVLATHQVIK